MKVMEFNTTHQPHEDTPIPPDGDGWMLGGSAATPKRVFHYWQRAKPHAAKVCRKCPAVAFRDGRCVGCDTPLED